MAIFLSHQKRLRELYRLSAKYRLDAYLPDRHEFAPLKKAIRLHPASFGKKPVPNGLKTALEQMGVLFVKLGQLLSTRSDLFPPEVIAELALLQDKVSPFDTNIAIAQIENKKTGLGVSIDELFDRFDRTPLATASIAQVHTAQLKDGKEVVVKVVRPHLKDEILADFELLRELASWLSARFEPARAMNVVAMVEDYRQIMLGELDLSLEAGNAKKMRSHFMDSPLIYVPEIYHTSPQVLVSEKIYGVPISQIETIDRLGYDRATLAEQGLIIFFKQVFTYNFFHADMHAGNIFVETLPDGSPTQNPPRYIGLDCAIMGSLPPDDQMTVARMLLAVMNGNFTALVDIIAGAGWIPPSADKYGLIHDMTRTVSPMILKPIDEIDFAGVLLSILEIARRHRLSIPPTLILLLKTLVHVEGLGRELYPKLDIWTLAKPILTAWVKEQIDPIKNLQTASDNLPQTLLATTDFPRLIHQSLQSMAHLDARQDHLLYELKALRADMLNNRRYDWLAFGGLIACLAIGASVPVWWGSVIFYLIGLVFVIWRLLV